MISPEPSTNGTPSHRAGDAPASVGRRRGPLMRLLDLFSSVWLGITLLTLLFIYMAIGSSGVPTQLNIFAPAAWKFPREWPAFEMSEFEWFHWWPFDLLILLLCVNLVITTVRRIRFNVVNLGVWMIHSGIIVLAIGSVIYFTTKIEGDTLVIRRVVVAELPGVPGGEPVALPALPGASARIAGPDGVYRLTVANTDPDWEILAEQDKGKRAYSVNVRIEPPRGEPFLRQLLAGYPQYTEDVVRTSNPDQPFGRAKKVLGKPLVDETLQLSLLHSMQQYNYLARSAALYIRELGTEHWHQRPIRRDPISLLDRVKAIPAALTNDETGPLQRLPRYNDRVRALSDVWLPFDQTDYPNVDPLDLAIPAVDKDDPLPDVTFRVTDFLRFASMQSRRVPLGADAPLDPAISIRLVQPREGQREDFHLVAFDPAENEVAPNLIRFIWLNSAEELEPLLEQRDAMLEISVPGTAVRFSTPIREVSNRNPDLPFAPIPGTDYSYRVSRIINDQAISAEQTMSVAMVEIRGNGREYLRWVSDPPQFTRDLPLDSQAMAHQDSLPLDTNIEMSYQPGKHPPVVLIAAGPGDSDLQVATTTTAGQSRHATKVGDQIPINEATAVQILQYSPRTELQTRPQIIPRAERERGMEELMSMIHIDAPGLATVAPLWLPYHEYAFATPNETLRLFQYRPSVVATPDGRAFELMFSRQRVPLPSPVVLDDFVMDAHVGGYTGDTLSVKNWTSKLRFENPDQPGEWFAPVYVSVNNPQESGGFWFFQAKWDAPSPPRGENDPGSRGLNFTILGVGNRTGVHVQLAGCCLAVAGMVYAFYIKPIIKRRRQQKVYAEVATARATGLAPARSDRPRIPARAAARLGDVQEQP